jgi:hypothetical protein
MPPRKRQLCKVCVVENPTAPKIAQKQGLCNKHGAAQKYCKQCLIDNPTKPSGIQKNGLCKKHNNMNTFPCRACVETYVQHPIMVTSGFCSNHKGYKIKPRCKICISDKVEKPGPAKENGLCIKHGASKTYCVICLKETPENPKQVYNNNLCMSHGAEKKYCTVCLEEKSENPKLSQKDGLCLSHGAELKKCEKCLELNVEKPNLAKKDGLCTYHKDDGGTTIYCSKCIELNIVDKKYVDYRGNMCGEHAEKFNYKNIINRDKIKIYCRCCLEENSENPKLVTPNRLCSDHTNNRKKCIACIHEKITNPALARRNGLCHKHGAPPKLCKKCVENNEKCPKFARRGGLCVKCGGDDTAVYCKSENCGYIAIRSQYCRFHFKENGGNETVAFCSTGCGCISRKNGLCYKHILDIEYKNKLKEKQNVYERKRYKEDINYMITKLLRCRFAEIIKSKKSIKFDSVLNFIGCSVDYLREYLESKFKDGMTWENKGEWHIDHIKPCASFDITDIEEQKKCFHYTNLQPLWAKDNISKGCKW